MARIISSEMKNKISVDGSGNSSLFELIQFGG